MRARTCISTHRHGRYSCLQCYHTHANVPRALLKELSRYFLSPPHWYDRVRASLDDPPRLDSDRDGHPSGGSESRPDVAGGHSP